MFVYNTYKHNTLCFSITIHMYICIFYIIHIIYANI